MKKIFMFLLVITLVYSLSACGTMNTPNGGTNQTQSTNESNPQNSSPAQSNGESGTQLTQDEALDIALNTAGVSKDAISGLRIELDRDDGITLYEIDFRVGQTEYEYDIHAENGTVLDRDRDRDLD